MVQKKRRGPVSRDELDTIAANRDAPVDKLAKRLNRSEMFVRKHLSQLPALEQQEELGDYVSQLHAGSFWSEIKRGLIKTEIPYFESMWASYMGQFGSASDILATDRLMIKDLIMLDIHSTRAEAEKADVIRRIKQLEDLIKKEESLDSEMRDELDIGSWRTQLNGTLAAKISLTREHIEYQKQKDAKLKDLKGSREQRFKQIEESRRNIFELIKDIDTYKKRLEEGHLAEKVKIAADAVIEDFTQLTEYEDGTLDSPFLAITKPGETQ